MIDKDQVDKLSVQASCKVSLLLGRKTDRFIKNSEK